MESTLAAILEVAHPQARTREVQVSAQAVEVEQKGMRGSHGTGSPSAPSDRDPRRSRLNKEKSSF